MTPTGKKIIVETSILPSRPPNSDSKLSSIGTG